MSSLRTAVQVAAAVTLLAGLAACADDTIAPMEQAGEVAMSSNPSGPVPPGGRVNVTSGPASLELWPWTGRDLQESPRTP